MEKDSTIRLTLTEKGIEIEIQNASGDDLIDMVDRVLNTVSNPDAFGEGFNCNAVRELEARHKRWHIKQKLGDGLAGELAVEALFEMIQEEKRKKAKQNEPNTKSS